MVWCKGKRAMRALVSTSMLVVIGFLGAAAGLGVYTFRFAEGLSYFSSNPKACVNCHIMREQYDSWSKSSHHSAATCVECHLPHAFIPKYLAKAENGYHHSRAFTFQDFHEPIIIKAKNAKILQNNCVRCHGALTENIVHGKIRNDFQCRHCHSRVGHGQRGISQ